MQVQQLRDKILVPLGFFLIITGFAPLPGTTSLSRQPRIAMVLTTTPTAVVGGNGIVATVTLDAPAPASGVTILLSSQTPKIAAIDGADRSGVLKLTVPANSRSASARVRTFGQAANVTATLLAAADGSTATTTFAVSPATVNALTIAPVSVPGGAIATGTIQLNGAAAENAGLQVQLLSSSPAISVPSFVTVPSGARSVTFALTAAPVLSNTSATISASTPNATRSATVSVLAPALSTLQLNPATAGGGQTVTGTVVLTGVLASRPLAVALSSSSPDATVPAAVTINAGSDRASFPISTRSVTSNRSVTIVARIGNTGTGGGAVTDGTSNTVLIGETAPQSQPVSATLTLAPVVLSSTVVQSIAVQPAQVTAGSAVTITVTLESPASTVTTLPVNIGLSTNQPQLLPIPTRVQIASGARTGSVTGTTTLVSSEQVVTITAASAQPVSTSLTIKPPQASIASVAIRPASSQGGLNVILQIALASAGSRPLEVKLATDRPELITLPPTVSVGATPLTLTLPTAKVKEPTDVTVKAMLGGQTVPVKVTLTPAG